MKKVIPEKVANKVYEKLLPDNQNRSFNGWVERILYKPETNQISNRFFKNKVTRFTYKCRCDWCVDGKLASTRKRWESTQDKIDDYLQVR